MQNIYRKIRVEETTLKAGSKQLQALRALLLGISILVNYDYCNSDRSI